MAQSDYVNSILKAMQEGRLVSSSQQPSNEQLAGSIAENLAETGEDPSILQRGSGILGRVFDVLSRPNYAVAEASQELLEGGNPVGGLISGLAGTQKTTFSDVLDTAGVDNRFIRGVGGLALDIALDPTTYLTGGIIKGATREAIMSSAGKAASEAEDAISTIRKAGVEARKTSRQILSDSRQDLVVGGRRQRMYRDPKTGQWTSKSNVEKFARDEMMNVHESTIRDISTAAAQKTAAEMEATQQGRVVLKLMGKEIGGSENLYRAGTKLAQVAKNRPAIQAINKGFRNNATFISGLNDIRRRADTVNIARYEKSVRRISRLFNDLTPEQHRRIIDAVENNIDLTAEGLEEQKKAFIEEFNQTAHDLEVEAGLVDPLNEISNYSYHIFDPKKNDSLDLERFKLDKKTSDKSKIGARKDTIKRTGIDPGAPSSDFTLRRAMEEYGLTPELDIRDVLANRLAKSYSAQGSKKFIDDAIREFGVSLNDKKIAKNLGLTESRVAFVPEGTYFPPEIEKSLKKFNEYIGNDEATQGLLGFYDKALSAIKFNQTVVNPGHHIRNMIGDIWNSFLDGVVDPRVYKQAARVQNRAQKFQGIDDFRNIDDVFEVQASPSMKFKIGNREVDEEGMYQYFMESGSKSGFYKSEFSGLGENLGKNVGQKITKRLRNISEGREDFIRLAHFIDSFGKEAVEAKTEKEFAAAAQRAGARVRKFNFDYGDLTEFERRKLKRIIPFYVWTRKNVPLQIESLALRPGRQVVAPKAMNAIEVMAGTEDFDPAIGPLSILPQWLKDSSAVALSTSGNGLFWNPEVLPVMALGETFGGEGIGPGGAVPNPMETLRSLMAGTSPAIRIPIEQMADFSFYRGGPETASNLETARDLIPLGRLTGRGFNSLRGNEGGIRAQDLLSWAGGISTARPTESQVRGELRRQEDIVQRIMRDRRNAASP